MRRMHYLRLEIARCHNIRALLQDYYCTFKFKVAMAMDQCIERFKTLRVHCSVTFHPQQIETIFLFTHVAKFVVVSPILYCSC